MKHVFRAAGESVYERAAKAAAKRNARLVAASSKYQRACEVFAAAEKERDREEDLAWREYYDTLKKDERNSHAP